MFLESLFGTTTKVSVLGVLASYPDKAFVERDLARLALASQSELNRQMPELVESGLVKLNRVSRIKTYSLNSGHFLFTGLVSLFSGFNVVCRNMVSEARDFLLKRNKNYIKAIFLLKSNFKDSLPEEFPREPSDIDLVVVASNRSRKQRLQREASDFVSRKLIPSYNLLLLPIVFSNEEFKRGLREKQLFIVDCLNQGELLFGEKPIAGK